ncbi:MAG: class I SAM-dependent methyltransferase [Mycoplasmataceae bacterium]|jgi:predicted O-methyltransferase YrrM|nr:class I SAM-dependent methyltransferase [Mycoplasmataceae bacterium]
MTEEIIEEIRKVSIENNVPIVRNQTGKFIQKLIDENKYENILEIGTAYGYSSALMLMCDSIKKIDTVEKDEHSFAMAKKHLANETKVNLVNDNAFLYQPNNNYDFIFLDGPKSHQEELLTKYLEFLKPNGMVLVDNIYLRKFENLPNLTKNQKSLIKKVDDFRNWLKTNKELNVEIIDLDDGIAIIKKAK